MRGDERRRRERGRRDTLVRDGEEVRSRSAGEGGKLGASYGHRRSRRSESAGEGPGPRPMRGRTTGREGKREREREREKEGRGLVVGPVTDGIYHVILAGVWGVNDLRATSHTRLEAHDHGSSLIDCPHLLGERAVDAGKSPS